MTSVLNPYRVPDLFTSVFTELDNSAYSFFISAAAKASFLNGIVIFIPEKFLFFINSEFLKSFISNKIYSYRPNSSCSLGDRLEDILWPASPYRKFFCISWSSPWIVEDMMVFMTVDNSSLM